MQTGPAKRAGHAGRDRMIAAAVMARAVPVRPDAPVAVRFVDPAPAVAGYVTRWFAVEGRAPQFEDVLPAGQAGLVFALDGAGRVHRAGIRTDPVHRATLVMPFASTARLEMDGPWRLFGAALTPLGWLALTRGLSAAAHGNRLLDAGEMLGPEWPALADGLAAAVRHDPAAGPEVLAGLAMPVLLAALRPVPERHVRLIAEVEAWLAGAMSPDVADLYARVAYSPRQLQRLVDRCFGLPPKPLARMMRALRTAAILADPAMPSGAATAVVDHFYDQSHMIRELRQFVGRTPGRLVEAGLPIPVAITAPAAAPIPVLPPGGHAGREARIRTASAARRSRTAPQAPPAGRRAGG